MLREMKRTVYHGPTMRSDGVLSTPRQYITRKGEEFSLLVNIYLRNITPDLLLVHEPSFLFSIRLLKSIKMTRSIMFSCLSFLVLGLANTIFAQNSTSSSNSTTVSADATAACNTIDILLPGVVAFPIRDLIRFQTELQAYWSGADSDLVPACITFPLNATQTSTIVKVLNNYTDVAFAIKSGGHNTNPGWSSVEGGVLIAFSSNAATTISSDYTTADIGPGARWYEVMDSLLPYGKCVPGGRIGMGPCPLIPHSPLLNRKQVTWALVATFSVVA